MLGPRSSTWMPAGPWARQHADKPQEGEKGQSAGSGAFLLPRTVQFALGCYFQLTSSTERLSLSS